MDINCFTLDTFQIDVSSIILFIQSRTYRDRVVFAFIAEQPERANMKLKLDRPDVLYWLVLMGF